MLSPTGTLSYMLYKGTHYYILYGFVYVDSWALLNVCLLVAFNSTQICFMNFPFFLFFFPRDRVLCVALMELSL